MQKQATSYPCLPANRQHVGDHWEGQRWVACVIIISIVILGGSCKSYTRSQPRLAGKTPGTASHSSCQYSPLCAPGSLCTSTLYLYCSFSHSAWLRVLAQCTAAAGAIHWLATLTAGCAYMYPLAQLSSQQPAQTPLLSMEHSSTCTKNVACSTDNGAHPNKPPA